MQKIDLFHRADLAEKIAQRVLNAAPGSAASSGLFLSAPRRTGKSTFIREDLRPQLQESGAVVIYADLWSDKKMDPGKVIVSAVQTEISKHEPVIKKLAAKIGVEKLNVGGAAFSVEKIGLNQGASLSDALAELSDEIKRPIVLIIDEAQHAITTSDGSDALFALKAARDEINSSAHYGLHIIATGSNQAKLGMLRNSKDQAFFGAHLLSFPNLGPGYVEWFCKSIEFGDKLNLGVVAGLFEKSSFRPEILSAAAEVVKDCFDLDPKDTEAVFSSAVMGQIASANKDLVRVIRSLTSIQFAVLKVMVDSGEDYAPFEARTLEKYREVVDSLGGGEETRVDAPGVQQALLALQEKTLVWKASRGVYAIEDASIAEVYQSDELAASISKAKPASS
ncbi:MAG: ATP-binding protein [Proteobacteria bacterium]|nr:ATP-binding protein [Pseudomonadota bacterium]